MSGQAQTSALARIGVVGLGRIGLPVARNLAAAGFDVFVIDTRPEVTRAFGERALASVRELVAVTDAVIIAVPGPDEDENVLLGPAGLIAEAPAGLLVIDFTTLPVSASRIFATEARTKGIAYLEAPVSGSQQGAIDGQLTIMVAGEADAFARARPLFDVLGGHVAHVGPPGTAMLLKLINQIIYISYMMAFSEGVAMGERAGLDLDLMLEVLATSAAGDPRIAAKFPQMRGDTGQCFSAANARKYFDFALADVPPGPIAEAVHRRLGQALAAGAGAIDVTALDRPDARAGT
ncbi:NAD(P)-dependent oxidoreductase [Novosphingobium album (ex Liu et al. 2023)]|uniref:NAD(P)-dependent oxidoreductase n=1 Tax=Novosphingobium album (ex Liu et al. 2023) TaxID=3031130 RepID=A0ABT5WRB2_9SPHN|nr:NAD(P)-dependent oxidoreductase [Novosphingobium album (ex Liu et al. 2023)]MDE8651523.1 NAD(P)-dependent oxidoreductase [Novosphingobium album (ex Liu et al. 2023)]